MADLNEVFNILADGTTGAGEAAISRVEGEAAAAQAGLIGFSFKDASGNVVLPQLSATGRILVDTGSASAGTCMHAQGDNATGSLTTVEIANLALTASGQYSQIEAVGSCLQPTLFQVVHDNDGTDVILYEFLVGAGQYSFCCSLDCAVVTAGASGTQELELRAKNISKLSCIRGTIAALEA